MRVYARVCLCARARVHVCVGGWINLQQMHDKEENAHIPTSAKDSQDSGYTFMKPCHKTFSHANTMQWKEENTTLKC